MNGNLPQPVEKMLEKQYEEWKFIDGDINVESSEENDIKKIADIFKDIERLWDSMEVTVCIQKKKYLIWQKNN